MKKVIIAIALVLSCFTTSLAAFEWGGLVNNSTDIMTPDFKKIKIDQGNEVYLWANTSLTKDKSLRFATEAMYKFALDTANPSSKIQNIIDLNLLKLSGNWAFGNNSLVLDVGRFKYSDKAGAYFLQKSDGLSVKYNSKNINVGFYSGYTGLQNRLSVFMNDRLTPKNNQLYDLTYGYVPLMTDVTFNRVGTCMIGIQAAYFLNVSELKNDKAYGTLSVRGPISNIGSYNVNFVAGTEKFKNIMLFASADMSFYAGKSILLSIGGEYASGDNGKLAKFNPITLRPVASKIGVDVVVPRFTGMFVFGDVVLTLNEKLNMSIPNGKISVDRLDSSINAVYNVFSDLQIGGTAYVNVDFGSSKEKQYGITVNAALAF